MSCFSCCLTGYGHCEKCSEYCCPTCRDNTCPSCDCEYCPRYLKQGECSGCHQRICNLCPDSRECAKCEKLFCGDPDESGNTGCTALEECDETWGCGKDFCDSFQEEQLVSCRQCNVKKCQDCKDEWECDRCKELYCSNCCKLRYGPFETPQKEHVCYACFFPAKARESDDGESEVHESADESTPRKRQKIR